ncbi:nucleoside-diphosphate sugar epimerase/dehydratase [uncultured Fretibacterium sp.]|uniref:polysaccharide biosynthesis protein n=1 Tax=uncultured Fretibacterium sp. TaxID=1678694 RepID=UPI00262A3D85|nr:nucleoside-diphosphate sugar epimerase/dehydratase [uncultured Fretibacterium sp.]
MRRLLLAMLRLWNRAANSGLIVALLDLLLLALACYLGYAIRLSLFIPALYARDCIVTAIAFPALASVVFTIFGQYKILWPQASLEDYVRFSELYLLAALLFILVNGVWRLVLLPRTSLAIMLFAGVLFSGALRVSWRLHAQPAAKEGKRLEALIVGAGEAGALLARDLMRNASSLVPKAFVDDDPQKVGKRIAGLQVVGDTSRLAEVVREEGIRVVLIAIPSAHGRKIRSLYKQLAPLGVEVRLLPSLRELAGGAVSVTRLRSVKLEDLLGRDPIRIDLDEDSNYIRGRRVLVTGAGGSIGSEIVRQVIQNKPAELLVLGHGEQSIYLLTESLSKAKPDVPIRPIIADVADEIAMGDVFDRYQPQLVFHAAAHKHVPLMEFSPREALRVNGLGTRTLARAVGEHGAERMVLISTDKAVNPSSVMGATKRVAERALEQEQQSHPGTAYMAVRFGNVLGSRGSVIPKFERQIAAGGPVTVTDPQMKRYFMLIPEAVSLVIQAGAMGKGGELFVLDMGEPVVITEMAELLIRLYGYEPYRDIPIVFTGVRPGEKLEEELFYDPGSVHPTRHPKIFTSPLGGAIDSRSFNALLDEAVRRPQEALTLLHRLVPEYAEWEGS